MELPEWIFEKADSNDVFQALSGGDIEFDGAGLSLGETEAALAQYSLELVKSGKPVFLINPVVTDCYPLIFGLAYQNQVSSSPSSLGQSTARPQLLCTGPGYIQDFDQFTFQRSLNANPIVSRRNLATDGYRSDTDLHYLLKPDQLPGNGESYEFGNALIDLRSRQWRDDLYRFAEFSRHHTVNSYIFFTDDIYQAKDVAAQLSLNNIEVTRRTLLGGEAPDIDETATDTRVLEHILHQQIAVELFVTADESLLDKLRNLYRLHKQVQQKASRYYSTGRLFRELSALCVPPSAFDREVGTHYGKTAITDLLEQLRQQAKDSGSDIAPYLGEFADDADELRDTLESSNLKQAVLIEQIQTTPDEEAVTIVVRDDAHADALRSHLSRSGRELPANTSITTVRDLKPTTGRIILVGLLPKRSTGYAFPPATEIDVIAYPTETTPIREQLMAPSQALSEDAPDLQLTITTSTISGAPETIEFSSAEIVESISERILSRSAETGSGTSSRRSDSRDPTPHEITFVDAPPEEKPGGERLTVYDKREYEVSQKPVRLLEAGDHIVRLEDSKQDLYEYIRAREDTDGALSKNQQLVSHWRDIVTDAIEQSSSAAVVDALQDHGSEIKSELTVELWASGQTIGPMDAEDTRRIFEIYEPSQVHFTEDINDAISWLRGFESVLGKEITQLLRGEIDPRQSLDLEFELRQRVMKVRDKMDVIQIQNVRRKA